MSQRLLIYHVRHHARLNCPSINFASLEIDALRQLLAIGLGRLGTFGEHVLHSDKDGNEGKHEDVDERIGHALEEGTLLCGLARSAIVLNICHFARVCLCVLGIQDTKCRKRNLRTRANMFTRLL